MSFVKSIAAVLMLPLLVFSTALQAAEPRDIFLENESWADIRFEARGSVQAMATAYHFDMPSISAVVSGNVAGPLNLVGVKLGIAFQDTKQDWEIYGLSPLHALNVTIQPGETTQLGGVVMQMANGTDLSGKEHWVIMQVVVRDPQQGEVFFYAHEPQE